MLIKQFYIFKINCKSENIIQAIPGIDGVASRTNIVKSYEYRGHPLFTLHF